MQGLVEKAKENFEKASMGVSELYAAMYYNDQQPDKYFYRAMALKNLGEEGKANSMFSKLISYAEAHIDTAIAIDYFAVSLPDLLIFDSDLKQRNKVHCLFLKGLGVLGLEGIATAFRYFEEALVIDNSHAGAYTHLSF
jgi:tetratricopeptide (TPR) repeat protein